MRERFSLGLGVVLGVLATIVTFLATEQGLIDRRALVASLKHLVAEEAARTIGWWALGALGLVAAGRWAWRGGRRGAAFLAYQAARRRRVRQSELEREVAELVRGYSMGDQSLEESVTNLRGSVISCRKNLTSDLKTLRQNVADLREELRRWEKAYQEQRTRVDRLSDELSGSIARLRGDHQARLSAVEDRVGQVENAVTAPVDSAHGSG